MPGHDNWTVITAGIRPPDPTRLLSSQRMHDLIADIIRSGKFDLVLFDTPPVLGLADAPLVAEHCEGLMLLVSLGGVDRSLPREAVQRIRSSGAPLLGIVTNSVRETSQSGSNEYGPPGYGAYSTSASYAYYADQDRPKNDTGLPIRANNRTQRWLRKLRDQKNKILYWLDH
jgi:Mrp family chromosome partitioning ATPase